MGSAMPYSISGIILLRVLRTSNFTTEVEAQRKGTRVNLKAREGLPVGLVEAMMTRVLKLRKKSIQIWVVMVEEEKKRGGNGIERFSRLREFKRNSRSGLKG